MSTSTGTTEVVVRKSILVDAPPEEAFRTFTEGLDGWWPLATHSFAGDDATAAVMEPRPGGRFYERDKSGGERDWGHVVAWEPPARIVLAWEITEPATELELRFAAEADGTRLELEHRGWERLAEAGGEKRSGYDQGWDVVLGRYVDAVRRD
jgi:uncharacterized protein YndB with AHSA1/START domain